MHPGVVRQPLCWVTYLWTCRVRFERLLAGLLACTLLTDCSRSDSTPAAVVRDSMGVTLVESVRPSWNERGLAWQVDTVPRLRLGVQDGPEEYEFFALRDALILDDGRIIVANAGSSELRFFDPACRDEKTLGQNHPQNPETPTYRAVAHGSGRHHWSADGRLGGSSFLGASEEFTESFQLSPGPGAHVPGEKDLANGPVRGLSLRPAGGASASPHRARPGCPASRRRGLLPGSGVAPAGASPAVGSGPGRPLWNRRRPPQFQPR